MQGKQLQAPFPIKISEVLFKRVNAELLRFGSISCGGNHVFPDAVAKQIHSPRQLEKRWEWLYIREYKGGSARILPGTGIRGLENPAGYGTLKRGGGAGPDWGGVMESRLSSRQAGCTHAH